MRDSSKLTSEINDLRRELHYCLTNSSRGKEEGQRGAKDTTGNKEEGESPEVSLTGPLTKEDIMAEIENQKNEIKRLKQQIYLASAKEPTPRPPENPPPAKASKGEAVSRPARKTVEV